MIKFIDATDDSPIYINPVAVVSLRDDRWIASGSRPTTVIKFGVEQTIDVKPIRVIGAIDEVAKQISEAIPKPIEFATC